MLDRATIVDQNFIKAVKDGNLPDKVSNIDASHTGLARKDFLDLFESQLTSRHLDLQARILKDQGIGYYTIGSSGHEGNAAFGKVFRHTDPAFLHYRSGALMVERSRQVRSVNAIRDQILSLVAAKDDPIASGRHKVFGSAKLNVPPQTSTIASHLPKAMGAAWALGRRKMVKSKSKLPLDSLVICNFGDASLNHATAQSAINSAQYLAYRGIPLPLIFICEDNGVGISVDTPRDWVKRSIANRPALHYVSCNGRHLPDVYLAAQEAEEVARTEQKPVFLHMNTVRLLGHAGSDVETTYRPLSRVEAQEAQDPLLHSARIVMERGYLSADDILKQYESIRTKVSKEAARAVQLPKLDSAADVAASIAPVKPKVRRPRLAANKKRLAAFDIGRQSKYLDQPRNLCQLINYALTDVMLENPEALIFGEDVANKGGVYSVTSNLQKRFGQQRVFDTLLDETSILGTALGAAQMGYLPIPEIQFLAYTHNAVDQIRGEASTLPFFSNGQFANPMIIRVAGLAYQKGFGGHFHNDNSFAFLREIPGVIVACPSNGADAALMLRECVRLAKEQQRVVVFLEPIALYHTKDLHSEGDGQWLASYPTPAERATFGEPAVHGDGKDLVIVSYGNGNYLSQQAAGVLAHEHGINATVVDLRWLAPLHKDQLIKAIDGFSHCLIVDETRQTGSLSEEIITAIVEHAPVPPKTRRVTADDCFIPTGTSWALVLPSKQDIVSAAQDLLAD